MRIRLGVQLHHSYDIPGAVELAVTAERLGYSTAWVPEAYGSDAVSVLGFIAARTSTITLAAGVLQMPARTPANAAMTAMTLDHLSNGRVVLGLGVSGPQVVEGWHGVPYEKPLTRTREYVEIVRRILRRDEPVRFDGRLYQLPLDRGDQTQKAIRSALHPLRPSIPIWLAANGPKNVALAAEIADGWLPSMYAPDHDDAVAEVLAEGAARRDPSLGPLEVATAVQAFVGPDIAACRDAARPHLALYLGGMGSRQKNFYKDVVTRYGYGEAASRIQDLYLGGKKEEAAAAVPDEVVDKLALVGPPEVVADQLQRWDSSRLTELVLRTSDVKMLEAVREIAEAL